jgi:hypothetical protein
MPSLVDCHPEKKSPKLSEEVTGKGAERICHYTHSSQKSSPNTSKTSSSFRSKTSLARGSEKSRWKKSREREERNPLPPERGIKRRKREIQMRNLGNRRKKYFIKKGSKQGF